MRASVQAWWARGWVIACAALVACGGGGGGAAADDGTASGTGTGSSGAAGSDAYVLFAGDTNSGSLAAFTTLTPAPGQAFVAHVVESAMRVDALAYDRVHDDLYALGNQDFVGMTVEVLVFAHASTLKPNAAPARTLTVHGLSTSSALAYDAIHDELWLLGGISGMYSQIDVLSHPSTLDGAVVATREISELPYAMSMALDPVRSVLYLGSAVYLDASSLTTGATPSHFLRAPSNGFSVAVDSARDIVYLADSTAGVSIVTGASTATPVKAAQIPFPSATPALTVAVDSAHDRLYVGAYTSAFVLENASTLTSASRAPAAMVSADGTSIFSFAF